MSMRYAALTGQHLGMWDKQIRSDGRSLVVTDPHGQVHRVAGHRLDIAQDIASGLIKGPDAPAPRAPQQVRTGLTNAGVDMIADVLGTLLTPLQRRLAALEKAPAKAAQAAQETRSSEGRRASGITPESRALISQARAVVAIARAARVLAH